MSTFGWFQFKRDPITIRHVNTNQSVTLKEGGDLTRDGVWSCEYVSQNDSDSILFDMEFDLTCSRNFSFPELRLNYNSIFTTPPDYTRWKLIDDFLTDALTCWPEFLRDRRASPYLRVEGAWCNGRWTPSLIRLFSSAKSESFIKSAATSIPAEPIYNMRHAKQRWEYVDCEFPQNQAKLDYACRPPTYVPYLGRDEPVTGFEGRVPYLVTKDPHAYIVPIYFRESMEHDYGLHPHAKYIYINDNTFYEFEMRDQYLIPQLHFTRGYGFRDLTVEKYYWPLALSNLQPASPSFPRNPDDTFSNLFVLPYGLWREEIDALTDAWSAWRRPSRKVGGLKDSYVGFDRNRLSITLQGGYSAGLRNDDFRVDFKYG